MGKDRRFCSPRGLISNLGIMAAILGLGGPGLQAQDANVLLDAHGEVRDDAFNYIRMALSGGDLVYGAIEGQHIKELMNEVVAFSHQSRDDGNKYWGRIAGSKYEAMTTDWLQEKFRALGMENIHRVSFDLGPQWTPRDWSLTATGTGGTLTFSSAYPAPPSSVWGSGRYTNRTVIDPPAMLSPLDVEAVWVGLAPQRTSRGVR